MQHTPLKYIIYARKSSEDKSKQIQSIESQIEVLKDYAKRNRINIVDILSEEKSGKTPGRRKVFAEMIEKIENKKANGILVWKLDRLARNLLEGGYIIDMLQNGIVQEIRTPEEIHRPTDNVYSIAIQLCGANQYSRDLSLNVKRGLKDKLKKGWMPCSAPLGYLNTKIEARGENYIVKDPERFPLLRKAWDLMLTGNYTAEQILNKLNDEWGFRTRQGRIRGGKPMSRSTIYRIFTNQFYIGMIVYQPGGRTNKENESCLILPGKHPAMVSIEEFDRVQMLLGRDGRPRPNQYHSYAFTGMIRCGKCNGMISATSKHKLLRGTGEMKTYILYYCVRARKWKEKCSQNHYTNLNEIENQVIDVINGFTIFPEFTDWALKTLEGQDNKEFEEHNAIIETHQKALQGAERQLANLTRMRMQEQIDDIEYDKERIRLKNEITMLDTKASQIDMQKESWLDLTKKAFVFASNARRAFLSGDAEVKRSILNAISLNWTLTEHKVSMEAEEWLAPLIQMQSQPQSQKTELEPKEKSLSRDKKRTKKGSIAYLSPEMRS
jgi:DNA invertase Pin-like site-specific DNA recombinase